MTVRPDLVAGVTVPYRVRFDECGADGIVRTSSLLRYAQDVAWVHSEQLGFDREWYTSRGLAWVVRAAELGILQSVPLGMTLSVSTRITGFRKVWARRRTEGRDETGVPVTGARNTRWSVPITPSRSEAAGHGMTRFLRLPPGNMPKAC